MAKMVRRAGPAKDLRRGGMTNVVLVALARAVPVLAQVVRGLVRRAKVARILRHAVKVASAARVSAVPMTVVPTIAALMTAALMIDRHRMVGFRADRFVDQVVQVAQA